MPTQDKTMNKGKTAANAITFVALVIGALVAANLVGSRAARRVDFTQDRLFSLSQASKDLVKNLPDRMTVKAFISKGLEAGDAQNAQYLRDLLEEYARASNGKFVWEVLDPTGDKDIEEQAEKLKVPKLTRTGTSTDKLTLSSSYLGVALEYGGKTESIPNVGRPETLEYQLTMLIKMLSVKKKKVVFAVSEGETSLNAGPQGGHGNALSIIGQLFSDYDIEQKPLTGALLSDDADALVIVGPRQAMSERGKYVIDQFLMKGKSVAFWVDGMVVEAANNNMPQAGNNNQPQLGRKNDHGLDDLLEHYGFKIHDDIVMEPRQNAPGPLLVRGRLVAGNYPTFPVATNLDKNNPISQRVQAVIFPMSSSVEQVAGKQPDFKVSALATSTGEAWRQAGLFVLDPESPVKPTSDKGPFVFAYAGEGKLTSFFAGKDHPNEKGEKVAPPAPNTSLAPGEDKPLDVSTGNARVVVVGGSGFASDEYLQMVRYYPNYQVDIVFALGILDWLVQDDSIAALRHKIIQTRPIVVNSEATPVLVKYGNVVGVPLLFILFGFLRWRLRTSRRRHAEI